MSGVEDRERYRIGALAPDDGLWLREMTYLSIFVPEGEPPVSEEILEKPEIRRYFQEWGRSGDVGVKGLDGDLRIGAAWLRTWSSEDRGYGWIDDSIPELSMAVRPPYRGLGIGTRLLERLFISAPGPVSLSVTKSNPAVRLYGRFGFEAVADDGETLTMLRKKTA